MNLGLWLVEMLAIGGSSAFAGWCLGNGHGYDEGYEQSRLEFVAGSGKRTFAARDELALALLKADPEAYFRITREAR